MLKVLLLVLLLSSAVGFADVVVDAEGVLRLAPQERVEPANCDVLYGVLAGVIFLIVAGGGGICCIRDYVLSKAGVSVRSKNQ